MENNQKLEQLRNLIKSGDKKKKNKINKREAREKKYRTWEIKTIKKEEHFICKQMFSTPQIVYNGNLLGCCFIQLGSFRANAFKDGLLKALNSPDFIYAKHMLTDLSIESKKGILCSNCLDYKFIKENKYPISSKV